jgi:electron transfer flavoprotein alpha subunit
MPLLLIADHDQGTLTPSTTATLTAAQQFSVPIHMIVMGHLCHAAAEDAASYEGVHKVWSVDHPMLTNPLAEDVTETLLDLAKEYEFILAPSSTFGKNILPRLAAFLDVAQLSDVIGIVDEKTFVRPIYAGNILATLRSTEKIRVMTIRSTAFDHAQKGSEQALIESYPFKKSPSPRPTVIKTEKSSLKRPELTSATIVVAGGRGVQTQENFAHLEELADALGAAIGAAKGAVDLGLISPTYQIGQTGKVVAPDLYIALGISGAIQHLTGMKESKVIVAINQDPEASIFQIADYGLVGDLTTLLPELVQKVKEMKKHSS